MTRTRGPVIMPTTSRKKPAKKTSTPVRKRAIADTAPPPMDTDMMTDLLRAIHDKADEIDAAREHLDTLIGESDDLIREAVDDGERYRDIAAAAGRTVPWVQMSLRRESGVSTHPAAPVPTPRIRKTPRRREAS